VRVVFSETKTGQWFAESARRVSFQHEHEECFYIASSLLLHVVLSTSFRRFSFMFGCRDFENDAPNQPKDGTAWIDHAPRAAGRLPTAGGG